MIDSVSSFGGLTMVLNQTAGRAREVDPGGVAREHGAPPPSKVAAAPTMIDGSPRTP
jgi:hypothetical protein